MGSSGLGHQTHRDISITAMTDIETLDIPILYSFRRCPYAMRARMALSVSASQYAHREVVLRDKPEEMIVASPKATVPVLVLPDGTVLEESLTIINWALAQNDPEGWLPIDPQQLAQTDSLISENDGPFKHNLDRYKYSVRYDDVDPVEHRENGAEFLAKLNKLLTQTKYLNGDSPGLADIAIFPFVRQFANTDRSWFDRQDLPALQEWLEDRLSSELFTGIMKKWPKWEKGSAEEIVA